MGRPLEDVIKRWTAKRKSALKVKRAVRNPASSCSDGTRRQQPFAFVPVAATLSACAPFELEHHMAGLGQKCLMFGSVLRNAAH